MLIIAIISMYFTIEIFNNWASFGFIIGTIFVFILILYHCATWEEYKKSQRLRVIPSPAIGDLAIPMMA